MPSERPFSKVLIANRGEIAVRIARAAGELGIRTVGVYSRDDEDSLHWRRCDDAVALSQSGAAAYLDIESLVNAALNSGCDAVHPGYGFLSENASFARHCAAAGIMFIGPRPQVLDLFGDKAEARRLAEQQGIPVARGLSCASDAAGRPCVHGCARRRRQSDGQGGGRRRRPRHARRRIGWRTRGSLRELHARRRRRRLASTTSTWKNWSCRHATSRCR